MNQSVPLRLVDRLDDARGGGVSTYTVFWMTRSGLARNSMRRIPDVDDLVARLQSEGISDILAAEDDQRPIGFREWRERYGSRAERAALG